MTKTLPSLSKKRFHGFSLIELSIVLIILGLLAAGVTSGTTLIAKARLYSARSKTKNSPVISIPDLTFWIESTSQESFTKSEPVDGESIAIWKDINPQSSEPLNLDVVRNSAPTYKLEGINKIPVVNFNGTNQAIEKSDIPAAQFLGNNQATLFLTMRPENNQNMAVAWFANNLYRFSVTTPHVSGFIFFDYGINCCTTESRTQVAINHSEYLNVPKIFSFVRDANSGRIYSNGKLLAQNNAANAILSPSLISNLSIGSLSYNGGYGYYLKGAIGEVIVFSRALTDSERSSVESYLSQKWRIRLD